MDKRSNGEENPSQDNAETLAVDRFKPQKEPEEGEDGQYAGGVGETGPAQVIALRKVEQVQLREETQRQEMQGDANAKGEQCGQDGSDSHTGHTIVR